MSSRLRNILLTGVDSLLIFAVAAVLPFAWIVKDGLGPDSVSTTGWAALSRTFMTFYVGPAILLLAALDLLLRRRSDAKGSLVSRSLFVVPAIIVLTLIALGTVSFRLVSERQGRQSNTIAEPTEHP